MTVCKTLASALGALSVAVTLSAVAVPAMATEPIRCAPGMSSMPDYARRAGLMTRFLDDGGNCRIHMPPAQSLVGSDSADLFTDSRDGNVFHGPSGPIVVPVRR